MITTFIFNKIKFKVLTFLSIQYIYKQNKFEENLECYNLQLKSRLHY